MSETTDNSAETPAPGEAPNSPAPASPPAAGAATLEAPAAPPAAHPAAHRWLCGDLVNVDAAGPHGAPVRGVGVVVATPDADGRLAVCLLPPAVLVDAAAVRKR